MEDNLESIVTNFFDFKLSQINTATLAIVEQVRDLGEQRVDVKPIINKQYVDSDYQECPVILSVPLVFPSSSTSAVTFPVNKGDIVLLVFNQNNIDVFKAGSHTTHDPTDTRMFSRRDAIAIPCAFAFDKAINKQSNRTLPHSTTDVVIAHNIGKDNECEIRVKSSGKVEINGNDMYVDSGLSTKGNVSVGTGATGSFTTPTGQVVTVVNGIVSNIF